MDLLNRVVSRVGVISYDIDDDRAVECGTRVRISPDAKPRPKKGKNTPLPSEAQPYIEISAPGFMDHLIGLAMCDFHPEGGFTEVARLEMTVEEAEELITRLRFATDCMKRLP